jgi:hypothetical protein
MMDKFSEESEEACLQNMTTPRKRKGGKSLTQQHKKADKNS